MCIVMGQRGGVAQCSYIARDCSAASQRRQLKAAAQAQQQASQTLPHSSTNPKSLGSISGHFQLYK